MAWLFIALFVILAGYIFLIMPRIKRRFYPEKEGLPRAFAHRGLYGQGLPENSLSAFIKAAESGYGIELDVRLTKDGQLVVIHDPSLLRMCGEAKEVAGMTAEEIQRFPLKGTGAPVPTLSQVLNAVKGFEPPLIVEMKTAPGAVKTLPGLVYERMKDYPGFWCVESFDPRLIRWFRRHAPQVIRGQLAYDAKKAGEKNRRVYHTLGAFLLMNFFSKPDFIAYRHDTDRNLSFRLVRRLFRPALAAWTVESRQDFEKLKDNYDLLIFESFEPDNPNNCLGEKEKQS